MTTLEVPSWEEFLAWPAQEVAARMRAAGPQVCVFPINGTRRWAWLEYGETLAASPDPFLAYMEVAEQAYVSLFGMLFEHGVETVLSPLFGAELLRRGEDYVHAALAGVRRLVESPVFTDFYRTYGVRVRFYGDFQRRLIDTPHAFLLEVIQTLTQSTASYGPYRLFLGLFADDVWEQIAALTVEFYRQYGRPPHYTEMVCAYYGEEVAPATLFLGFDRFSVYDYPLLASGQENLYFTVAPSPYLDTVTLRKILYDYLYCRPVPEPAWERLAEEAVEALRQYYRQHARRVHGVGRLAYGVWLPEDL